MITKRDQRNTLGMAAAAAVGLLFMLAATRAEAQAGPRSPGIGYVYPAGARAGDSIEITIGGQFLDGPTGAVVSGTGVRVTVLEHTKPMTQQAINALRAELDSLLTKGSAKPEVETATDRKRPPEDEARIRELRGKLAAAQRRPPYPALSEMVRLRFELSADAECGEREVRLHSILGLSNPLVFHVGRYPEVTEPIASGSVSPRGAARRQGVAATDPIPVPAIANGRILPGEVDRLRFSARKGQRIVLALRARQLIPYLADAVPGWFQATLELRGPDGRSIAYADDYRFDPDPVLAVEIPEDGEYRVEIRDALYRGREDFVYRLALGEIPFLGSVFPLGGRAGTTTRVTLDGWNLPRNELDIAVSPKDGGIQFVRLEGDSGAWPPRPFAVDDLPEVQELEPNSSPVEALTLEPPVIVNGRVEAPLDVDVFRFEGRAGGEIVAEVRARSLGSPLDGAIFLTDPAGRTIASSDDREDPGSGLETHHADPSLRATLPVDGIYHVHVRDAQGSGSRAHAYRLRLGKPRADFDLRVLPATINGRAGSTVPISIQAVRRDGFEGEIAFALVDPPPGFVLTGAILNAGEDCLRATLTLPPTPREEPYRLAMVGRAQGESGEILRPAIPAEDRMQAFAYRHLVCAREWLVTVGGKPQGKSVVRVAGGEARVRIPVGGKARVRLVSPAKGLLDRVTFALSDPPEGISLEGTVPTPRGAELILSSDAAKCRAGIRGNLIVLAAWKPDSGKAKGKAAGTAKGKTGKVTPFTALPAIPFECVPP